MFDKKHVQVDNAQRQLWVQLIPQLRDQLWYRLREQLWDQLYGLD